MSLLICPVCGHPLQKAGRVFSCDNLHSYDLAKKNYVNLLADGGQHGDSKAMILARRDFLERGYYAPLRQKVAKLVSQYMPQNGTLLDAGCGECYYTEAMANRLSVDNKDATVYAFDIAKDALAVANRRPFSATKFVASCYHIPIKDESIDLLTCLFSPLAREEFSRVLTKSGIFIEVIVEKQHLFGLKQVLYTTPYKNEVMPFTHEGFRLLEHVEVHENITLVGKEDIGNLFLMTPYSQRTPKEGRERLALTETLTTEIAFSILVYQKT